MTIKAVIFDYGGVFTNSPLLAFAQYERTHGLPEKFIGGVIKTNMHDNAWAKLERSEISADEFDKMFAQESKAAGHEMSGATLLDLLSLMTFHENMITALERLQSAGFKTGCITNNMPVGTGGWDVAEADKGRAGDILKSFDHVIESAKAGVRKPEPRIYEMMCDTLDVAPNECVFLDDLGVNLKPAKAMGMITIKVPLMDVSPAIDDLARVAKIDLG